MSFAHIESVSGSGVPATVTFAATPSAGELLVASVHLDGDADLSDLVVPSGFSLAASRLEDERTIAVYAKHSDGTEGSITFDRISTLTDQIGVIARRFSKSGSYAVGETSGATATNALSITVGPITASAGDLVIATAMRHSGGVHVSWSDSFIGNVEQSLVSTRGVGSAYKISAGGSESTTRTLDAQTVRQAAVLVAFSETTATPTLTATLVADANDTALPSSVNTNVRVFTTANALVGIGTITVPTSGAVSITDADLTLETGMSLADATTYRVDFQEASGSRQRTVELTAAV